jgi:hypothetical protein
MFLIFFRNDYKRLTAGVSGKSGALTGATQRMKKPFSADSPKIEPSPLLSAARGVRPVLALTAEAALELCPDDFS